MTETPQNHQPQAGKNPKKEPILMNWIIIATTLGLVALAATILSEG